MDELALDRTEAALLAGAIAEVASHYDNIGLTDKQAAWLGLGQVACVVYGPRAFAIVARKRGKAKPGMGHNGGPALDPEPLAAQPLAA